MEPDSWSPPRCPQQQLDQIEWAIANILILSSNAGNSLQDKFLLWINSANTKILGVLSMGSKFLHPHTRNWTHNCSRNRDYLFEIRACVHSEILFSDKEKRNHKICRNSKLNKVTLTPKDKYLTILFYVNIVLTVQVNKWKGGCGCRVWSYKGDFDTE